MANIICLDFDDTAVLDNTTRQVFERFAGPGWRDDEARYKAGDLSVEQFNARAIDRIEADRDEIVSFIRSVAEPRPGLMELTDWAHWNGWQVAVVSNGFDFAVHPVLDDAGLDRVVRHCGRTSREYRWKVKYLSPRGIEVMDGFKLSYAASFKNAGDFVVYAGDGASDVEAAKLAGAVFARSTLLERLEGARERLFPFETFDEVVTVLQREAARWAGELLPG